MKNDPQGEFQVTGLRAAMAAYAGQLNVARGFGEKQREAAGRLGFKEAWPANIRRKRSWKLLS